MTWTCRCAEADCYTQFADCVEEISKTRKAFRDLSPDQQETELSVLFFKKTLWDMDVTAAPSSTLATESSTAMLASDSDGETDQLHEQSSDEAGAFLESGSSDAEDRQVDHDAGEPLAQQLVRVRRSYKQRQSSRRRGFVFLGRPVCCRALERLLAVGSSSLQKLRSGVQAFTNERRLKEPRHPTLGVSLVRLGTGIKWPTIVEFLWQCYHSTAEGLPKVVPEKD